MEGKIEITNLSKMFSVRHNRSSSLKSIFIGMFHKRYRERIETFWAIRDINLVIHAGESMGIIGRNGSGKSTLLRVIAGIYPPTSGEVRISKNVRVGAMIEIGVGFHPELTGKENVFLGASIHGLCRKEIETLYPAVVEFSELHDFMDIAIKNYSSGMLARLGFALSIKLNPSILIIDEVLAVGDEEFQKKCLDTLNHLRVNGRTIIFVSHDPHLVQRLCDRVCVLDHGHQKYVGKADLAIAEYHKLFIDDLERKKTSLVG